MKRVVSSVERSRDKRLFRCSEHAGDALTYVRRLREERELCDVKMVVGGREFFAHKVVLVSTVPYLRAMFASGMKETRQSTIELKGVDADGFRLILDYAYSGEVEVTTENVQDLLSAANFLQMANLRDACCDFLEGQLEPGNCLGIRSFADVHGCGDLARRTDRFICQRFVEVVKSEEFLNLQWTEAKKLLSKDEIQVRSEEFVFEAACSWLHREFTSRQQFAEDVLHTVRLPLLKRSYIKETVLKVDFIQDDKFLQSLVKGVYMSVKDAENPLTKHRATPETIYVVGGRNSRQCLNTTEKYDAENDQWIVMPPMKQVRTAVGLASLDGILYAIGGECESHDGTMYLDSCEQFNPYKNEWERVCSMAHQRSFVGVVAHDRYVYAIGGEDMTASFNYVECYDPEKDEWLSLPDMRLNRSGAGVAVLDNKIYVVGGHDRQVHHSSVEVYDPIDNTWSFAANMTLARSGVGICVIDNVLYAFGGRNRTQAIYYDVVERFDLAANRWERLPVMKTVRAWPAVAVLSGKAYVCGGYDGRQRLNSVEVFDPCTNDWKEVGNLIDHRAGASAAVA